MLTMAVEFDPGKSAEEGGERLSQLDERTSVPIKSSDELGLEGHEQEVSERAGMMAELIDRLSGK